MTNVFGNFFTDFTDYEHCIGNYFLDQAGRQGGCCLSPEVSEIRMAA